MSELQAALARRRSRINDMGGEVQGKVDPDAPPPAAAAAAAEASRAAPTQPVSATSASGRRCLSP